MLLEAFWCHFLRLYSSQYLHSQFNQLIIFKIANCCSVVNFSHQTLFFFSLIGSSVGLYTWNIYVMRTTSAKVAQPMPGLRVHGRILWSKTWTSSAIKDGRNKANGGSSSGIYREKNIVDGQWMMKLLMFAFLSTGLFIFLRSSVFSHGPESVLHPDTILSESVNTEGDDVSERNRKPLTVAIYSHLSNLALDAQVKDPRKEASNSNLWKESNGEASLWKPCANSNNVNITETSMKNSRYILVSANGGLNQQRVAICNAVAVAVLLNATLVLPKFLYSNVWKDPSQFGDIYQVEYFIRTMKRDINIVKELPPYLKPSSIDLITDSDLSKEAKPEEYIRKVLPILQKIGVVHLLGFGNRLGFDPMSFNLQRLRCKCNFHSLKFVPKIQLVAALLIKRLRTLDVVQSRLDTQLSENFISRSPPKESSHSLVPRRYLALHLRFEIDMIAYSTCDFGGGENERRELEAYREEHFPLLIQRLKQSVPLSPEKLRKMGRCPLSPEEAALVLAAVGFDRGTFVYVAGSGVYGGISRMQPLYNLYPNVVTKKDLLAPYELEPFRNFSSQLAALDFIVCAAADVFAMTESGSQLSSLVSGFRSYHGGARAPILRPDKKWLAAILSKNTKLDWIRFKNRVQKMISEGQKNRLRQFGQSIYRKPYSPECMCKTNTTSMHKFIMH